MADNYLEKRMDDYARGRLSAPARRSPARGFVFPKRRILTICLDGNGDHELVATLCEAGHAVMFTSAAPGGRELAQRCGARYYPMAPEAAAADIRARGEAIDVAIIAGGDNDTRIYIIEQAGIDPGLWIVVSEDCGDIPGCDVIAMPAGRGAAVLALALMHPALSSTSPRFRVRSGD